MCTAVCFCNGDHYYGRTLDWHESYNESIVITPRNFPIPLRHEPTMEQHYAMIGTAIIVDGFPLYYDAANEKGLCIAGLNFPQSAQFHPYCDGLHNIAVFEWIPWLLGSCATLQQAHRLIIESNLVTDSFNDTIGAATLHWLIADSSGALTVESMRDGLHIHPNPIGVMTNEPDFSYQTKYLSQYAHLTAEAADNNFAPQLTITPHTKGLGAYGLPGDLSSDSRFVRAAFTKLNAVCEADEEENISQCFHILDSVAQVQGCVRLPDGAYDRTIYSACCNTSRGIYYYNSYENRCITAVDLYREDLNSAEPIAYPMRRKQNMSREKQHFIRSKKKQ